MFTYAGSVVKDQATVDKNTCLKERGLLAISKCLYVAWYVYRL